MTTGSSQRAVMRRGLCLAFALLALTAALAGPAHAVPSARSGETRAVTSLSLTATPDVVDYGGSATLSGHLASEGGAGIAGAALAVTSSTDGVTWSDVAGVTTDANGDFALEVTPVAAHGATMFCVVFAGDAALDPVATQITIGSRAALAAPSVPRSVGCGSRFVAAGLLQPRHPAGTTPVTIACYRLESDVWILRATFVASVDDSGDASLYSATVRLPSTGVWTLAAEHADAAHAPSVSDASARVTVTAGHDAPIWDRDGTTTIPERMASRLNARQIVVVTGSRLGSRTGTLRLYTYRAGDWVRTMEVPARWGERGLTNGATRRAGTLTTPTGIWRLPGFAFGTHVRAPRGTELRWRHITQYSWWSSEHNATYNTWVETSRCVYGEHLADYPQPYEYAISSGYNARPNLCVYGRGSAIFLHVVHRGYSSGCVTVARANMVRLLRQLDPDRRPACAIGTRQTGTKTCIYAY